MFQITDANVNKIQYFLFFKLNVIIYNFTSYKTSKNHKIKNMFPDYTKHN